MARRTPALIDFAAVSIEGGLIAPEMLNRIGAAKAGEQAEPDYGLDPGVKIRDEIGFAFSMAETLWARFRQGGNVERFAEDLLRQVFGFRSLAVVGSTTAEGNTWPIARTALNGRVPVVVAPAPAEDARRSGLDESLPAFGDGNRRRSATLLVQEYLNAADNALWGVATDGRTLRILRDNSSLTRPAWIEVDIAAILGERLFADFSVLWLLLHESRFGRIGAAASDCPLERWREAGRAEGVKARERLSVSVEQALVQLGNGFLKHPDNAALRDAITTGTLTRQSYFQELLRFVYRFIFLFTAEDRDLLHPPSAKEPVRRLYAEGYSLGRLRDRAVRRTAYDRHHDLFEGVKLTIRKLAAGEPKLGLPALGALFLPGITPHLEQARLANRDLLAAIHRLAWLPVEGRLERVNWRDMETEELGSVYESLLELVPEVTEGGTRFRFAGTDESRGNARKTSGSYYTPDALVELLLDSALDPVIDAAVAANPGQEIEALLELDVVDPACGSGHFLLAAARRIAARIAQFQSPGAPSAEDYRHALREVARHCLYGVDRNPMAVELCKVALWIETVEPGKPLSFLDGRIREGDSLIGVFDFEALENGIPDEAYKALTGDSKEVSRYFASRNRKVRKDKAAQAYIQHFKDQFGVLARTARSIDAMPEDDLEDVERKSEADRSWRATPASQHLKDACNLFVAAFFLPKTGAVPENRNTVTIPTSEHLGLALAGKTLYEPLMAQAVDVAARISAFHWHLQFPEVFAKGGFDCVLGNPPWERMKLQEQEFFASRQPEIARAGNKAARERLIAALIADGASGADRRLHAEFQFAKREAEAGSLFARSSGRFPLTGIGDVNTYALFAEHFTRLVADGRSEPEKPKPAYRSLAAMIADSGGKRQMHSQKLTGRAGIILPTGIATDSTTSSFFGWLTREKRLIQFLDFQTGMGFFDDIGHARFKFALMTVGAARATAERGVRLAFFLRQMNDLTHQDRFFELSAEDISRLNPNTKTLAAFRSKADAELTSRIYNNIPVLIEEGVARDGNPWKIRFSTMFHMSNDSGLFRTAEQLIAAGAVRRGVEWSLSEAAEPVPITSGRWLPLYEAKMIHHYDHRWATYDEGSIGDDDARPPSTEEKHDHGFDVYPRYWVPAREVYLRIADLPPGLITALRRDDTQLIVLGVVHLLFGRWLLEAGVRSAEQDPGLFQLWQRFVEHHGIGRSVAPTSLGIAGDNPPCPAPLNGHYIPAQPIGCVTGDGRSRTAWYLVDHTALQDYLEFSDRYGWLVEQSGPVGDQDSALQLAESILEKATPRWLVGWRDISNAGNERTLISSPFPLSGVGNKIPLFLSPMISKGGKLAAAYVAMLSSISFDYVVRQKLGGTTINFFIMQQFAALPPSAFSEADLNFIVSRVLELTYTSHSMKPFAEDLGFDGPPYAWDEERRARLRAELDVRIARIFGLSRDELRYILDPADVLGPDYPTETFRVLRENEIRRFGEYRTRRLVLEAWDRMEAGAELTPARQEAPRPRLQLKPAKLSDRAWARPMQDARSETGVMLAALLKAMEKPMPPAMVRSALVLALNPVLLLPQLGSADATEWSRLIGPEAEPRDQNVRTFMPRADAAWGEAVRTYRGNGLLIEDLQEDTWAPGAGLDQIVTSTWPDGRAHMVWKALAGRVIEDVIQAMPEETRGWVIGRVAA